MLRLLAEQVSGMFLRGFDLGKVPHRGPVGAAEADRDDAIVPGQPLTKADFVLAFSWPSPRSTGSTSHRALRVRQS